MVLTGGALVAVLRAAGNAFARRLLGHPPSASLTLSARVVSSASSAMVGAEPLLSVARPSGDFLGIGTGLLAMRPTDLWRSHRAVCRYHRRVVRRCYRRLRPSGQGWFPVRLSQGWSGLALVWWWGYCPGVKWGKSGGKCAGEGCQAESGLTKIFDPLKWIEAGGG